MSRSIRNLLSIAIALTVGVSAASATTVTSLTGTSSWGYAPGDDVKSGGSASIVASPSNDGDGSLRITTDSSIAGSGNAKAYVGTGGSFGLLSDLQSLSFDFLRDSSSTTPADGSLAFKLFLSNGASLTWEYAYNHDASHPNVPTDTWQHVDLTTQNFWLRYAGTNYAFPVQVKTPSGWATYSGSDDHGATFDSSTSINGIQIGYGSGLNGQFIAYADNVRLSFAGGNSFSYNFAAVPTPASFAGGAVLLGGLAVMGLRRKTSTV
jgi:hypothetical protein